MDGMLVLAAVLACGLFAYLIIALVKPEMFA